MFLFSGSICINAICVIVAVFSIIYIYFKWVYQTWKWKKIPYHEPSFPFGSFQPLNKGIPTCVDFFNIVKQAKEKGWNYFGLYSFAKPFFVPIDLDLIKSILIKDFNNFVDRGFYYNEKDDPMSAHLFALEGQKWKNVRVKLSATFSPGKLKAMLSTVTSGCSILEKTLEEHNSNTPLDIKEVLIGLTLDVFSSCAFGVEGNNMEQQDTLLRKYAKKFFERNQVEQLLDLFMDTFPRLARALHMKALPSDVSKFFHDFVSSTVSYREKHGYTRNDFLQLLIDIKNNKQPVTNGGNGLHFNIEKMVAYSYGFFLGGFETTSTTMTFLLYELSRHPEMQTKVREELFEVLEKHDYEVSYEALKELVYMQKVIDETLRKYPVLPFLTRLCVRDYKVPNSDVVLKKGTNIMIPIQFLHHDESIYENPDKFDPERFSPEQKKQRHPCSYIPFGEGPRNCIGMRFGLMEMKLTLSKLLSKFKITLNPKTITPLQMDPKSFVPLAKGGIWLNVEKI